MNESDSPRSSRRRFLAGAAGLVAAGAAGAVRADDANLPPNVSSSFVGARRHVGSVLALSHCVLVSVVLDVQLAASAVRRSCQLWAICVAIASFLACRFEASVIFCIAAMPVTPMAKTVIAMSSSTIV